MLHSASLSSCQPSAISPHSLLSPVFLPPLAGYILDIDITKPVCLAARSTEVAWQWHARFGHLGFQGLKTLSKGGMVRGLPPIEQVDQLCDSCLAGKQRRRPFPATSKYRAQHLLELVHADLCGPITPETPDRKRLFLLVVDDKSRYMWLILLASKDQAAAAIIHLQARAEAESGRKLGTLRTDRGGEFTAHAFGDYCAEQGVQCHLTAPYTPQQNGVVERRNQTVLGMARSMMKAMKLPGWLWGEAVLIAVFILNRSPTRSVDGMTPFEAWYGIKPPVHFLRTFGCVAHVKVAGGHQQKLADRSMPMIFIGYEPGSKAYRFYSPDTGRVIISRDAVFDKARAWDWSSTAEPEAEGSEPFIVESLTVPIYRGAMAGPAGGETAAEPVAEPDASDDPLVCDVRRWNAYSGWDTDVVHALAELHASLRRRVGLAVDGHLGQEPPHRRRHLEPVPGEPDSDHHVLPEFPAEEHMHDCRITGPPAASTWLGMASSIHLATRSVISLSPARLFWPIFFFLARSRALRRRPPGWTPRVAHRRRLVGAAAVDHLTILGARAGWEANRGAPEQRRVRRAHAATGRRSVAAPSGHAPVTMAGFIPFYRPSSDATFRVLILLPAICHFPSFFALASLSSSSGRPKQSSTSSQSPARYSQAPPWISNPLQPRRHNLPSFLLDLPFATLGDRIAGNRRSPNGRPPLTTENHLHVELPSPATISSARPSSPCSIGFRAHFRGSPPADLGAIAAGRDRLVFCIVLDLSLVAGELAVGRNGRSKAALWSYVSVEFHTRNVCYKLPKAHTIKGAQGRRLTPDFSPDDPTKDPGSLGSQPGHPVNER
nr:unnamed protein product [Digitaria exilis]